MYYWDKNVTAGRIWLNELKYEISNSMGGGKSE